VLANAAVVMVLPEILLHGMPMESDSWRAPDETVPVAEGIHLDR
jgi:hypothetical protein